MSQNNLAKLWCYGTLIYYGKTMVQLKKIRYYGQRYYTEIYWTSIYKEKHVRLTKTKKLLFIMGKNYGNIPKQLKFFQQMCSYRNLIYFGSLEKTMVLWNKYGTTPKTVEFWLTIEKLWYCPKNYETLIYYGKNYGTMKKRLYYDKLNFTIVNLVYYEQPI